MSDTTERAALRAIIEAMRSERSRYKSHDLGYVDSVSASQVDDWADELEAQLATVTAERDALLSQVDDLREELYLARAGGYSE